jgi:hypothetical protein
MKNKKVQLLYFAAYFTFIFILLYLSGCFSPTETPKGNLTGIVNLEGLSDHSGIIIALYDLAYLDTTIVRINNQYPQIGVHINQHTEFDHRLQSPIKTTETLADGSFAVKRIPTGIYNLVAIKDGWGFRHMYEIEVIEGESDLSDIIPLYEEIHISGDIFDNIVVATDHHLIIGDETDFIPGSSLTICPGAVIRINPGVDITIHGSLIAQGEDNNMFWVTSNDGFGDELAKFDSLQYYQSMRLSDIASVENDLIKWGKWDWGNTCLLNTVNNLHMHNSIFRNGGCGLEMNDMETVVFENCLTYEFLSTANGSITLEFVDEVHFLKNISIRNSIGVEFKDNTIIEVENNYLSYNKYGANIWGGASFINNNDFISNTVYDVTYSGDQSEPSDLILNYNEFRSNNNVLFCQNYMYPYYGELHVNNNNFYFFDGHGYFIKVSSEILSTPIDARFNYFGLMDEWLIDNLIYDENENGNVVDVLITPFWEYVVLNSGIY